jgi:hypothetical protein
VGGEDDKNLATFLTIFRDIPVLKDIPPAFRTKVIITNNIDS